VGPMVFSNSFMQESSRPTISPSLSPEASTHGHPPFNGFLRSLPALKLQARGAYWNEMNLERFQKQHPIIVSMRDSNIRWVRSLTTIMLHWLNIYKEASAVSGCAQEASNGSNSAGVA
jgi:hypothetical protein